jgi:hypothetical protein
MYFICEIQVSDNGTAAHIIQTAETRQSAFSKYYGVLQYAAVSELPRHSCIVFDDRGMPVIHETFTHPEEESEEPM